MEKCKRHFSRHRWHSWSHVRSQGCDNAMIYVRDEWMNENFTTHDAVLMISRSTRWGLLLISRANSCAFSSSKWSCLLFKRSKPTTPEKDYSLSLTSRQIRTSAINLLPYQKRKKSSKVTQCRFIIIQPDDSTETFRLAFVRTKNKASSCQCRKIIKKRFNSRQIPSQKRQIYLMARKSRLRNGETETA